MKVEYLLSGKNNLFGNYQVFINSMYFHKFKSFLMKFRGIPIAEITIFKNPKLYFILLLDVIADLARWIQKLIIKRWLTIVILSLVWLLVSTVTLFKPFYSFLIFAGYWVVLGVASSIGLGTGLHTFVLYLGPHIAKVAMVATSCGNLPEMIPSRWQFDHFGKCQESSQTIGFFGILLAIQIQSFLWGFGTALGELPPYFVAKKASETRADLRRMNRESEQKAQSKDEEEEKLIEKEKKNHHISSQQIEEILQLKRKIDPTLMERAKILIYDNLEKYGFFTILACASIPNPLFDLAGITCGHFRIPFRTFFTATFIGKAIIKVHIQMLFVIAAFRKQTLGLILGFVSKLSSGLSDLLAKTLQAQRKVLHQPSTFSENKPLIARIWDLFIIGMVVYFLLSIITAEVQEKAIQKKDS